MQDTGKLILEIIFEQWDWDSFLVGVALTVLVIFAFTWRSFWYSDHIGNVVLVLNRQDAVAYCAQFAGGCPGL